MIRRAIALSLALAVAAAHAAEPGTTIGPADAGRLGDLVLPGVADAVRRYGHSHPGAARGRALAQARLQLSATGTFISGTVVTVQP